MTVYFPTGHGIHVLYEDGLPLDDLLPGHEAELVRNSHVEPVPGQGIRFQILWNPPFSEKFGEVTLEDEEGQPFRTRQSAVDCEIRMILRDFYGYTGRGSNP